MTHPHMLLLYGGRATLAQGFAIVEQFDRGLCVEEAGRLSSIMTTTTSQPKTITEGSNKGQTNSKSTRQVAMAAEEETPINSRIRCWGCGELSHSKKDCPNSKPSDGKGGANGGKGKVIDKNQHTKGEGQGKSVCSPPKCSHPACGRI